ncbi:hypothetical protein GOBAR_AA31114 [Gossypium barbadense]|uniref:Transposase MuDR plant domain-containing protein n=1 Tax=Gossypium barbadense TaxID=3634 RepID=A0A2P5WEQ7_GOSBA|nr:hypothetical protein GOBAR_AA31114 [Gossypium barbadense]
MKLVDDENVKTMVELYCQNQSLQTDSIKLFAEAYVDKLSTIYGIDIDLNAPPKFENLNSGPRLQIQFVMIETNVDGDYRYDNNSYSDYEVEDYSGPGLEEVTDDIDDKGASDDGNVNAFSVENSSQGIVIHNDLGAHMLIIEPDATHASEFLEYPNILPVHRLVTNPECKELFVGQKFATKEDCIFFIRRYSMNVSID